MKQIIASIIIIVALIVFFIIIDRKEFSRHDDVQTVQSDSSMANINGLCSSETTPVIKAKPVVETKPIAEAKSVAEPADTKPVVKEGEARRNGQAAPVPVVTAEEAQRLNEFAIFLSTVITTVVEGEILERSELPDPQKSDYPNCRFTAHLKGNTIKSGDACPREIVLIIDGFENFNILSTNTLKKGDKVICSIIPIEELPEEEQATQQADDLELFHLNSYYVANIKTIKKYSDTNALQPSSGILFSEDNEKYISIFERHINPPIPDTIKNAQRSSILEDLRKMKDLLVGFDEKYIDEVNEHFADVWKKEKRKDANGYNRIKKCVWRNIDNSFWALPEDYILLKDPLLMSQNMLKCFQSLKKACEENGVQLIVSIVPNFYDISARVINKEFRDIPDLQTATYVKQLSEIGIEAIYASDTIIQNYNRFPFAFFFPSNYHPGDTTQDVLSDIIAERLLRYELDSYFNPSLFSESQCVSIYGPDAYLFPHNCDIGNNKTGKPFMFRKILYDGKVIPNSKDSSVLVIGNSFIQVPVSPPDSFPVLLSYKMCSPIHWVRRDGFGPFCEFLTELLFNPDSFLKNKRALIMHVGTDHITTISNNESMIDVSLIDREQLLFNNKSKIYSFVLPSNTTEDIISSVQLWGPLSNQKKAVFCIDQSGEINFHFNLNNERIDNSINNSKPIYCVVSHTCPSKTFCQLNVNGISKMMFYSNLSKRIHFFNHIWELPAGTKEITITVKGKINSIFAIKDIQIWQ